MTIPEGGTGGLSFLKKAASGGCCFFYACFWRNGLYLLRLYATNREDTQKNAFTGAQTQTRLKNRII